MKVTLAVNGFSSCLIVLEVPHHDVSASENDLSISLLVRVVNLQVSPSQSEADGSKVEFLIALHSYGSCGLTHAINTEDGNVQRCKVVDCGSLNRRRTVQESLAFI